MPMAEKTNTDLLVTRENGLTGYDGYCIRHDAKTFYFKPGGCSEITELKAMSTLT